jgi:ribosomal protein S18 acetylase RimI-like enzyme
MFIEQIDALQTRANLDALVALLQDAVEDGASIGFLSPLAEAPARAYWEEIIEDVQCGTRILLVGREDGQIVGTVQLGLPTKPNASHRAEVQKLLVHTAYRGRGLGKQLLAAIEAAARAQDRTLLVLDTRQGDVSEHLYRKHGYSVAGVIPQYARSSNGQLDDCVFFYRFLA